MSRRRKWDRIELQQFFQAYRTYGPRWAAIAENLPGRSVGQVSSLGKTHKVLLNSPSSTADSLCEAVQHHYASQSEARARRRQSKRSDEDDESKAGGKRKRGARAKVGEATKRSRKTATRRRRKVTQTQHPTGSARRKRSFAVPPENIYMPLQSLENVAEGNPHLQHVANTVGRAVSTSLRRFSIAEWCYSAIDRGYFLRNEFDECLAEMRVPAVNKLCRAEWAAIRTVMGRPRRLSATFLAEERGKLERYRHDAPVHSLHDSPFVYQVPVPLAVGQHVTAFHPLTRSLAMGCILTRDLVRGIYRVQFDRPELGVHRCMDTDILPHGAVQLLYPALASHSTSGSPVGFTPHDSWRMGMADVEMDVGVGDSGAGAGGNQRANETTAARTNQLAIMVQVQQLLNRKEALVQHLKTMNVGARAIGGGYSESFRRGYTWLLMCLEATNRALDPVLQSMRRLRNLQGVATGLDVAEKLRVLLSRCDEKAAMVVRKNAMLSSSTEPRSDAIQRGTVLQKMASALSFLLAVKECSQHNLASWETWALLERGLNSLKPQFEENSPVFAKLEATVAKLRQRWAFSSS